MPVTCAEMHQALVDSIEKRWKPLAKGKPHFYVPECQLCVITKKHVRKYESGCTACPLALEGYGCEEENSTWLKYCYSKDNESDKKCAQEMLSILIKIKDKYFPEGWDK